MCDFLAKSGAWHAGEVHLSSPDEFRKLEDIRRPGLPLQARLISQARVATRLLAGSQWADLVADMTKRRTLANVSYEVQTACGLPFASALPAGLGASRDVPAVPCTRGHGGIHDR